MLRRSLLPLALLCALAIAPVSAHAARSAGDVVPGSYIVTYKGSVASVNGETVALERSQGFKSRFRYGTALRGFSARLNASQVAALRRDSSVESVTPNRIVHATATAPLTAGESVPTGIRRIRAGAPNPGGSANTAATAGVAVLDTGIQLDHPDLNAVAGTNCVTPGASPSDDNGHGTHVAGTIGASNGGAGVVGVAPGTQITAVKVLDAAGSATWDQIICGINWVAANSSTIKVASMSLGGGGTSADSKPCGNGSVLHDAICAATANGVAFVVAAGNSGWDFDYSPAPDVPATYPEVLTVTAASDSDGQAGGLGAAPGCRTGEVDDRYASFSNYAATSAGAAHTLAAPGVCINSTWMGSGYSTISGTSMATPHVTGDVALCFSSGACTSSKPADVIPKITYADPAYGFAGDPSRPVSGRYYGWLALAGSPPPPAPSFTLTATPSSASVARSARAGYTLNVSPSNGFNGSVTMSVTGLPSRTSATFSPNPATGSSALNVSTTSRTPRGTFTLTVKGVSGSLTRTTTVTLRVT